MDRHEVHRATVDGFRDPARAVVAITTQVCEMSLDIDADLLISELAPVPALVQRFGRANRHRARGNDFRATIVTYAPAAAVPYTREDLGAARAFLAEVSGEAVSQRDLAEALERHAPGEPAADGSARLLESGYYAIPGPFRDDNDHTQPAVLDGDLTDLRARINARRPYDGLLVPMPMRATLPMDERPGWVPRYLGVASSVRYHPHLGFLCDEL